jgi:Ca-activated chloride channel family protein
MSKDLKLKCELSKEFYLANSQPQIAYVLIEAKPSGSRSSGKTPFNLGLVMDRSASMKGEKI